MEKCWQLNRILWKQYLMRHRIWLALFLAVGIFLCIFGERKKEDAAYCGISIGVLVQDDKGAELLAKLQEEEGIFHFLSFEEEAEMLRQIESGSLECGFVLPEGFYENLIRGRRMRQINLYYSPSSAAHKISYELVFSYLFELLSDQVLLDYVEYTKESGAFTKEEIEKISGEILERKEYYAQNGSTFSFVYEQIGKEEETEVQPLNTMRGCIAVLVFLMSLLGLAGCCELEGILQGITGRNRIKIKEVSLNISIFGSVFFGGIMLFLTGTGEGVKKEAMGLAVYFVVLQIYTRFLRLFVKKAEAVYGLIPVFILGSLLFCPVFIQIRTYLPAAAFAEKIFPVSYYLNLF